MRARDTAKTRTEERKVRDNDVSWGRLAIRGRLGTRIRHAGQQPRLESNSDDRGRRGG
jgi:hypothetical protein